MTQTLQTATSRLTRWLTQEAIPFWKTHGIITSNHASHERMTANGTADLQVDIRVRVQARQAFFFSAAFHRGWCDDGQIIAARLLEFVEKMAAHPTAEAGYVHLLNKDFAIVDTKQDLYDHAFFLLAFAWSYRASGEAVYLHKARALVSHLDQQFGSPVGGWTEGDYAYTCRRQNPHMHLFEAFLALYDATGEACWLSRAGEIFNLFQTRFYDHQQQVLFEFFDENWLRLSDKKGDIVEPGHMMEWVWLLDWYGRRAERPVGHYTRALYQQALDIGMSSSGLLYDAITASGEIVDPNKRLWGMTELIKASLVQIRAGNTAAEAIAIKGINDLFDYYLCSSTPGCYVDRRGDNDQVIVDVAPASTLYHLIVAVMELLDHASLCDDHTH